VLVAAFGVLFVRSAMNVAAEPYTLARSGLAARDAARRSGKYVSAEAVLAGLDKTLARTRKAAARK
ncbi:MAG: hypothetical protein WA635_03385, partial [Gallionella sp.]